jgi:hypothetical protein
MAEVPVQYPSNFLVFENDQGKYELTAKDKNECSYPASVMRFQDPGFKHDTIDGIRYANVDGRKYFCVRDAIMIATQSNHVRACTIRTQEIKKFFDNLPMESKVTESITMENPVITLKRLQFSGPRERFQDCIPLTTLIEMFLILPSGQACKKFRTNFARLMTRYFAGDPKLIEEINANAKCKSFLNEAAREELPHAQMDQIREEVREEREAIEEPTTGKRVREEDGELANLYKLELIRMDAVVKYNHSLASSLVQLNPLRKVQIQYDFKEINQMRKKAQALHDCAKLGYETKLIEIKTRLLDAPSVTRELAAALAAPPAPVTPTVPVAPVTPTAPVAPATVNDLKTLYDMATEMGFTANMSEAEVDRINKKIGHDLRGYSKGKKMQRGFYCNLFNPEDIDNAFRDAFQQMTRPVMNQQTINNYFGVPPPALTTQTGGA